MSTRQVTPEPNQRRCRSGRRRIRHWKSSVDRRILWGRHRAAYPKGRALPREGAV